MLRSEVLGVTRMIYLASPFWHESEEVRLLRVNLVRKAAAELMEKGYVVYSPIAHCIDISKHLYSANRHSHEFWMKQDLPILQRCDALWVLMLDGWRQSRGLQAEIHFATDRSIPTVFTTGEAIANFADRTDKDLSQSSAEGVRARSAPAVSG